VNAKSKVQSLKSKVHRPEAKGQRLKPKVGGAEPKGVGFAVEVNGRKVFDKTVQPDTGWVPVEISLAPMEEPAGGDRVPDRFPEGRPIRLGRLGRAAADWRLTLAKTLSSRSRNLVSDSTQVARQSGRRWWLFVAIALALIVGCGLLYYGLRSAEPTYQGRTSAEWFREFQTAASRHWTVSVNNPGLPSGSGRALDVRGLLREPAADGLRGLGTNAAVYLGRKFAWKEGILARSYRKWYFGLPASIRGPLPRPPVARYYLRMEIGWALQALGSKADAAVPWLITSLGNGDEFAVRFTLRELQRLQFDGHQLDPLLEEWSRKGQHTNAVLVVAELHVRTLVAANCLVRALSAGDATLRRTCVFELEQFQGGGLPAVPNLAAALKDPDDEVRYGAARALEAVGSGAAAAIPALMQASNDTSVMVQRASARALRVIQGQTAE